MVSSLEYTELAWVRFAVALLSLCCSSCTLFLIYYMRIRNGYFLLISSMTVCQIMYDINFLQGVLPSYENCVVWHVLDYWGGLSFSVWSNVLSFIVLYIVVKIQSLNIYKNYWIFFLLAMVIPFSIAMMTIPALVRPTDDDSENRNCTFEDTYYATVVQGIYYWGRILTILFNFTIFLYVSFRVRMMTRSIHRDDKTMMVVTTNPIPSPGISEQSDPTPGASNINVMRQNSSTAISQSAAIVALVSRMKYYPLAQAVARSGSAWDQFDNYHYSCFASQLMSAICGPSSGILNFIIFLVMQPKAFQTLRSFFVNETLPTSGSFVSRASSFGAPDSRSQTAPQSNALSGMLNSQSYNIGSYLASGSVGMQAFEFDEDMLDSVINDGSLSLARQNTFLQRTFTLPEM